MHILVTGGAGFIGSHLIDLLLQNSENRVTVIDNLSTGSSGNIVQHFLEPRFQLFNESILWENDLHLLAKEKIKEPIDVVVHLAAAVGVKNVVDNPLHAMETNIRGTENILKIFGSGKRVIVASSSEVYGKSEDFPLKENGDCVYGPSKNVRWNYAYSKAIDEFQTLCMTQAGILRGTVLRFFNVIGTRQVGAYGMVVPNMIDRALDNKPIDIYGQGDQKRCFTDVRNVVRGIYNAIYSEDAVGEVINLGSTNEISIVDLARLIQELCGNGNKKLNFISYREAYGENFEDMRRRVPDLRKANTMLNYHSQITLQDAIETIISDKKCLRKEYVL